MSNVIKMGDHTVTDKCAKEIGEVLAKYQCYIDVAMIVRPGQITPQIKIMQIPEQTN